MSNITGYDWRKDIAETNSSGSPKISQIQRKSYTKQPIIEHNDENIDPAEPKPSLEEQINKLTARLAESVEENKKIRGELIVSQNRQKEIEEELKQKNRRIDELERDKWTINYKMGELEKQNCALQEAVKSRVDPKELSGILKRI